MRWALKVMGWSLGAVILLLGLAGVTAYVFVTSDYVRAQIETRAGAASGRKTTIARVSIDWGWTSRVHLEDVEVANADWAKADYMFKAQQIELDVPVWPLLHGDFILSQLTLIKPEIYLERNAQEELNWSPQQTPLMSGTARQVRPESRHQTPRIGRLEIKDGRAGYADAKRKLDLDGTLQTATGQASAEPQAELSLSGRLEGQPFAARFVGGSGMMLRETGTPYPVDLDVSYGATRLTIQGSLEDPVQFMGSEVGANVDAKVGANLRLSLTGQDLSDIYPLLRIPVPPTPPYRITGNLRRGPGIWRVADMVWHTDDSDLTGDVAIDQRNQRWRLTAHLVSQRLAFADLAILVGATPGRGGNAQQKRTETQARDEFFPNGPLHFERLRSMDMDVSLEAKRVIAPSYVPVQALAARVQVDDGQALVRPLDMTFGGGKVAGDLAIDARTDNPKIKTNLRYQEVDLAAFFRGSRFFETTKGKLKGRIVLAGSGRSIAQIMGTASGDIVLTMAGGTISGLLVSLAGLQIGDALLLNITGDNQIPIRCALGRLKFDHGVVTFDRTLMDTRRSVLHFDGQARLATQVLDSKITADAKQFDPLNLHAPVVIQGKIRSPAISIGRKLPIPTPVIGGADDVACEKLIGELVTAAKP